METWIIVDLAIVFAYGLQHTILTTRPFIWLYNKLLPSYSWNFIYSVIALITLIIGFHFWQPSGVYIFHLTPGSFLYHVMTIGLSLSLFLFFYCFKYTTSFWQWLGIKQIADRAMKRESPQYYRLRTQGVKRYIRFPHHTCLIFFFWLHPAMTLDTLLLAISATVYLYLGTYHQDLRGLRIIGEEWADYRKSTNLLFPGKKAISKLIVDIRGFRDEGDQIQDVVMDGSESR
jgi:hypothetical protein